MRTFGKFILILSCALLVSGCDRDLFSPQAPELIDPDMNLSRQDYKNVTVPGANDKNGVKTSVSEPPIPDLAEILAAPSRPKLGQTQLVSIAVTDDVPLKDVLIELARLADVDIEVDANIVGGIAFRAKDKPFNEVIERIADLAGLRYSMKNNVLRVERDTPYVQIYSLDFLNLERNSQSNVNVSTSVLSASTGATASGGLNNGSSSNVTSKADSDFWKQFEESIKKILTFNESKRISSGDAPVAAPVATPGATAAAGAKPTPTPVPVARPAAAAAAAEGTFYILSRQASTLTVSGTEQQHSLIRQFIRKIQANGSAQVLIEAKIVEVTLADQFQSGIDWTRLGNDKVSFLGSFDAPDVTTAITAAGNFKIGTPHQLALTKTIDLSAAVALAEKFGTTRTLSSPRLHAINNQQAVMTFAQNFVYFSLTATQSQSTTSTIGSTALNTITVNSTAHTVPIGIIMTLQPSINMETNEITLSVRPTLSRIASTVNDPAVAFTLAQAAATTPDINLTGISSAVPIIEVRELDSILKLKSGQVMVIGGLMQDNANNTDAGLPGVSHVPVFGSLFKGVNKEHNMQELIIFIRATIVDSGNSAGPADKSFYDKFTRDPRPLTF